jgi:hypothetical protein
LTFRFPPLLAALPGLLFLGLLTLAGRCSASADPLPPVSGIDGTDRYTATVCPGTSLCFDLFTREEGPDRIVRWECDFPGAQFDLSDAENRNAHFCWTPRIQDARPEPYRLTVFFNRKSETIPITYILNVPEIRTVSEIKAVTCHGDNDGVIRLRSADPSAELSFRWEDDESERGERTGLKAGRYTALISQEDGCALEQEYYIDEPEILNVDLRVTPSDCRRPTGRLEAVVSGGTWPYTYRWNGIEVSEPSFADLRAGQYRMQVTDANGCNLELAPGIPAGTLELGLAALHPASCPESEDGSALLSIRGGVEPFEIEWFPYGGLEPTGRELGAGTYTVQVADQAGCTGTLDVSIGWLHPVPKLELPDQLYLCTGQQIALNAGDEWTRVDWGNGLQIPAVQVNSTGIYKVEVTDAFGCRQHDQVEVVASNCGDQRSMRPDYSPLLRVSPNPVTESTLVTLDPEFPADTELLLTDIFGKRLQQIQPGPGDRDVTIELKDYPPGAYLLTIMQPYGRETVRLIKQ